MTNFLQFKIWVFQQDLYLVTTALLEVTDWYFINAITVPPEVTFKTPRRISQALGKEVMLECFVAAFPQGVSTWNKDGKPVGEGMEHRWKYRTEIYREDHFTYAIYLRIINLETYDFGMYSCEASNALGTDTESILLSGETFFHRVRLFPLFRRVILISDLL